MKWTDLIQLHAETADAGTGAGADAPPVDTGKDLKIEVERKEALLKATQAEKAKLEERLAKIEADAEKSRKKDLEEQGRFKELNETLTAEKAKIEAEANELRAYKKQIEDAKQAELDALIKDMSDDDKRIVDAGNGVDGKLIIAKRLIAVLQSGTGSSGPVPKPGMKQSPNKTGLTYPTMKGR